MSRELYDNRTYVPGSALLSRAKEAIMEKTKPTIAELEALLDSKEHQSIEILPSGEIRAVSKDAEIAALRGEVERLRAENAQLKCNFAPILHFARQEQEKRGEPSVVIDSEGIPIENAVLRRNYITLRSQLERAEAELAAERGKVEKVREWMTESGFCSAPFYRLPYCKKCVIKLEQILK